MRPGRLNGEDKTERTTPSASGDGPYPGAQLTPGAWTISGLHVAGGHLAQRRAAPVRVETPPLASDISAQDAFALVLARYASAIAENLRCVLTDADIEGAHQLRVTLRRLRTALRIFKPVIRRSMNQRLAWFARYLGAIVGDLRDADVMVEEIIRPAIAEAAVARTLMHALEAWREGVRASVRASLSAARATAFTVDLALLCERGEWRRAKPARERGASALVGAALDGAWARAAQRGRRFNALTPFERHELRKDVKALRYTAELAPGDAGMTGFVHALKRLQTSLGYLNDLETLAQFTPPLVRERDAFAAMRERILADHAQAASDTAAATAVRWRALEAAMQTLSRPGREAVAR